MTDHKTQTIPVPTLRRLPSYLEICKKLQARGRDVVSCTHIAEQLHLDPTQVRKDIATTGIAGRPRVGYRVDSLVYAIQELLGWNNVTDAFLVGAGSLGTALLGYHGFDQYGLNIVAAFDVDPAKVGRTIHGRQVLPLEDLPGLAKRMHIRMGIIAVPPEPAQQVADLLVRSGMKAIWNFAPAALEAPAGVVVENVELAASLAVLSGKAAALLRANGSEGGSQDVI